jgi:excisionase family DNA binding protein
MTEPLLKAEELARLLNVRPTTVYAWAQTGFVPHIRIGGCVRFDRVAVDKWLATKRRSGRATRVPA